MCVFLFDFPFLRIIAHFFYLIVMLLKTEMKNQQQKGRNTHTGKSIQVLNFKIKHTKKDKITHTHKIWFLFARTYNITTNIHSHFVFIFFALSLNVKFFFILFYLWAVALYRSRAFSPPSKCCLNTIFFLLLFLHVYSIVSHFIVIICHFRCDVAVARCQLYGWLQTNTWRTHTHTMNVIKWL